MALEPAQSTISHKLACWVQDLGSAVTQQLHPILPVERWPLGIHRNDFTGCREHLDGIDFTAPLPLQITSATNQDLEGVTKFTAQPGDELGVLPVVHAGLHILQQTHYSFHSARVTPPANAEICMIECQCEIPHVSIRATHLISEGSEIVDAGEPREIPWISATI